MATPIVVAILSSRDEQDAERDDALVAAAAELAVEALRQTYECCVAPRWPGLLLAKAAGGSVDRLT